MQFVKKQSKSFSNLHTEMPISVIMHAYYDTCNMLGL